MKCHLVASECWGTGRLVWERLWRAHCYTFEITTSLLSFSTTKSIALYCHLTAPFSHRRRRTPNWRILPTRLAWGHVCERLSWLMTDVEEPIPLWVLPSHRQVVLGYIRKLAEHNAVSQPVSSILPWLLLPESSLICSPYFVTDSLWSGRVGEAKPTLL